jgi:hypothetical protein
MEKNRIIAIVHTHQKHLNCGSVFAFQAAGIAEAETVAFNIAKVTDATVHQINPAIYIIVN